jgi:hypothetical protein
VFLYSGHWVARCPRQGCHNAEQVGRCDDGTTGGLDGQRFYCRESHGGCGFTCAADWPPNISDIEKLVMCRPVPATRNWLPGEDLHDLLQENLEHGIVPTEALEGADRPILGIIGDEVRIGSLESMQRPEIGGS